MKLYYTLRNNLSLLIVPAMLFALASCSSYQYSGYEADGIYGESRPGIWEQPAPENNEVKPNNNNSYYKNLFAQQSEMYGEILESDVFTDVDDYTSNDGYENYSEVGGDVAYVGGNAPWGNDPDTYTINIINNGFYGGFYSPWRYGYAYGFPHYGGWYDPFWPNYWGPYAYGYGRPGWNIGFGFGYGYGYGYGGFYNNFGYPYNNGYYNRHQNYAYNRGRRDAAIGYNDSRNNSRNSYSRQIREIRDSRDDRSGSYSNMNTRREVNAENARIYSRNTSRTASPRSYDRNSTYQQREYSSSNSRSSRSVSPARSSNSSSRSSSVRTSSPSRSSGSTTRSSSSSRGSSRGGSRGGGR